MNPLAIGKFISKKRKEKNLTQEQLAKKLGVSDKIILKWETGKCMPDYSVIKRLCEELGFTIAELMDGEEAERKSASSYDDCVINLLKRIQELERQRKLLYGILLIVIGFALQALSYILGGSAVKDFFSGLFVGISIAEMVIGVYTLATSINIR